MEYYLRNIVEFEKRFNSEKAYREYLFQLRWPDGFRCPCCQHNTAWSILGELYKCKNCGLKTSVTTGTIFQDTRKPFRL